MVVRRWKDDGDNSGSNDDDSTDDRGGADGLVVHAYKVTV